MSAEVSFDDPEGIGQGEESFVVVLDDERTERMRIHEYGRVYPIPGLYEHVVHERLRCRSPEFVADLLAQECERRGIAPGSLRVLDIGSGTGLVGEELAARGITDLVGIDNVAEAEQANRRDRPGRYRELHTLDLTDLPDGERARLAAQDFNCLTCIGALGLGHIPDEAFLSSLALVAVGSPVVLTIHEDFLRDADSSSFARLIRSLESDGRLALHRSERFHHRNSTTGRALHYAAVVAEKRSD